MNESDATPLPAAIPSATEAEANPATVKRRAPPQRSVQAVFTGVGFVVVAAALFYIWHLAAGLDQPPPIDPARIASLDAQTRDLRQRLAAFETRLLALEQRPAAAIDPRPLEARLAALENRPPAQATQYDVGPIESRLAAAERMVRLHAAGRALDAGQPLGAIDAAPPALARFATAAPPTLGTLRAAFPAMARAARLASSPAPAADWRDRVAQAVSGLVTVRHGNDVLIGAPSAQVLAAAQERLEAGDLAGAVAALDALDAGAAAAAAPWKDEASALLAARAALARP